MPLVSGTKLGPYEIEAPLGVGGMGEVYRARDKRLDRTVAIKILPSQLSSDPVRKQRFEREAKTISSLNHPHICILHDIGSQNGLDYLVMECVEGQTLAQRLEKGPLPLDQVLKYGAQMADALDKAHRSGVVHRDLKPGNIMLTAAGAKLMDFGLAKPLGVQPSGSGSGSAPPSFTAAATLSGPSPLSPLTTAGSIIGTIQYMAPEQIEGKEADAIIEARGWRQITDESAIEAAIDAVIAANPSQLAQYRSGKDKLFGFFVGQTMKATQGKANPARLNELLKKKLSG